eukprot:EG_transcript_19239
MMATADRPGPSSPMASPSPQWRLAAEASCSRCGRQYKWLVRSRHRCHFCGQTFCDICTQRESWLRESPGMSPMCTCYQCKVTLDPDGDGYPTAIELEEKDTPTFGTTLPSPTPALAVLALAENPAPTPPKAPQTPEKPEPEADGPPPGAGDEDEEEWVHLRKLNIHSLSAGRKGPRPAGRDPSGTG